ncbi:MAG TPA: hypothetical protein VK838_04880 [Candidatus Limnocylindrales bacterium]|nr:hypothetical protein [Candidatus Limnocylindrales bacterium]
MNDTSIGFLILGLGILLVLALVFAVTLRGGRPAADGTAPPRGVHLPAPSMLPVVMSLGAALLGAGLSFKPDTAWDVPVLGAISGVIHPILGPLGLLVLVYGIWSWVRAAGREWRETEREAHDAAGH